MKKRTKIALTAAVLLLVCGIGLCTAAFAVGAGSGRLYEEMQEFPSVQDIPEKNSGRYFERCLRYRWNNTKADKGTNQLQKHRINIS